MLRLQAVTRRFPLSDGSSLHALGPIDLDVAAGARIAVVGPSGCGKTTLLRIIAGLDRPTSGALNWSAAGESSSVGLIFQEYPRSLFPWLTVLRQTQLAARASGLPRSQSLTTAREALGAVGLSEFETFLPGQLSGGMQQRLAVARCLAARENFLLLDEPFGSVDALSRYHLEDTLLRITEQRRLTLLVVTHDIDEAVYLSTEIIVLSPRPGQVIRMIPNSLPRERSQGLTRSSSLFAQLRRELLEAIDEGSRKVSGHRPR